MKFATDICGKKGYYDFANIKLFLLPFQVAYDAIKIPKWSALSEMHPVDYYSSYTKNCTGNFTEMEIKNIRAFYYAMCAETDAMLGRWYN